METEELQEASNPWPAVRWMTVALVFIATVAIGVDQVKSKERIGAERLRQAQAALEKSKAETKDAEAAVRALMSKLELEQQELAAAKAALSRASNAVVQETRRASALQGLLDKSAESLPVTTLSE
jgi:hypothetical protein